MPSLLAGIDVVELARFRRFVRETAPDQLAEIFTDRELADVAARADAVPGLAGRFAAKEAVIKALLDLSGFALDWREVEIVSEHGAPRLKLHGAVADLASEIGVYELIASISHSHRTAIAQVVGLRRGNPAHEIGKAASGRHRRRPP